jgi:hypothetical protein
MVMTKRDSDVESNLTQMAVQWGQLNVLTRTAIPVIGVILLVALALVLASFQVESTAWSVSKQIRSSVQGTISDERNLN